MAERGHGDGADVIERHVVATLEQRSNLCAEHQRLKSARAGTVASEALNFRRRVGRLRVGPPHDAHRVAQHGLGHRDLTRKVHELQERRPGRHECEDQYDGKSRLDLGNEHGCQHSFC